MFLCAPCSTCICISMCLFVCACAYISVCAYLCACTYVCFCVRLACEGVYSWACPCAPVCLNLRVRRRVCAHVCVRARVRLITDVSRTILVSLTSPNDKISMSRLTFKVFTAMRRYCLRIFPSLLSIPNGGWNEGVCYRQHT